MCSRSGERFDRKDRVVDVAGHGGGAEAIAGIGGVEMNLYSRAFAAVFSAEYEEPV